MTQEILNPQESFALSPEALEFTNVYLSNLNIEETCKTLNISVEEGSKFLRKKEVKRFLDTVFLEQGYTSRFKLKNVLTSAIESKLEEAEESGVYSNKDLFDLIKLMMDFRKQEAQLIAVENELKGPSKQTNVQVNNYNNSLSDLITDLVSTQGPDEK